MDGRIVPGCHSVSEEGCFDLEFNKDSIGRKRRRKRKRT